MIYLAYSTLDRMSMGAAGHIMKEYGLAEKEIGGLSPTRKGGIMLYRSASRLLDPVAAPDDASVIYFISQHSSASGVSAFTTHAAGNWGEAGLGGAARQLSVAAPLEMLGALARFAKIEVDAEKTYEATHHGPLLGVPSLFVEFGGGEAARADRRMAELLGEAVYGSASDIADGNVDYSRVVLGIGGTHYPSKFSRLAIEKGYAFSHIMPKHGSDPEMLEQAVRRSSIVPESAVIDWKGINSYARSIIIERLDQMGIDYERV